MRILIVATISNTINAFLIPHIKYLIEKGNKVDIACNIVEEINLEIKEAGCKVNEIGFQRNPLSKKNFYAYRKIRNLILRKEYDLIHTHTPVASFITRFACRKLVDVKILYTVHGFHFFKGASIKNWLIYYLIERFAAKYTDGIITINEEDYELAKKFKLRKPDSIYKVHGVGINLDRFLPRINGEKSELRREYGYNLEDYILFYAAELNHNKHQDLLIKTINLLKHRIPNIKLLLAGNGPLFDKYNALVKKLGLEKKVVFLGRRKDISNMLKVSNVAVASSRREGLPVNVMEAMATGLPLIVTDCRGHRDLVKNNINGCLVGINDVTGFAKAIIKLYELEELAQLYGKRNIEIINLYSLKNVMIEIDEVYTQYLKE